MTIDNLKPSEMANAIKELTKVETPPVTSAPMTETTWAALKTLRDGGNLVPGM